MTEIEKKALALVNEVRAEAGHGVLTEHNPGVSYGCCWEALCRAIEQHEAFRKEVSDVVEEYIRQDVHAPRSRLSCFIIPKPDPLVDAMNASLDRLGAFNAEEANNLRAALAKRGLQVTEIER